jgi:hypothetical protein
MPEYLAPPNPEAQSIRFAPARDPRNPHSLRILCESVETSINNLYFRRRIHHASRYFSNLDLFFWLPGNSFSDLICWITLTGNTYHAFSGTT